MNGRVDARPAELRVLPRPTPGLIGGGDAASAAYRADSTFLRSPLPDGNLMTAAPCRRVATSAGGPPVVRVQARGLEGIDGLELRRVPHPEQPT